jgi:hypothetical protein
LSEGLAGRLDLWRRQGFARGVAGLPNIQARLSLRRGATLGLMTRDFALRQPEPKL